MSKAKFTTWAESTLAEPITATATALSTASGDGVKFPTLGADQYFKILVENSSGNYEIMDATVRTGDDITVTRGRDGTTARAFSAGDSIKHILTGSVLSLFPQGLTVETQAWTPGAVANQSQVVLEVDVAEAEMGDFVFVSYSQDVKDLILDAQVTAANKVTVVLANNTAAPITPDAGTLYIRVIKR